MKQEKGKKCKSKKQNAEATGPVALCSFPITCNSFPYLCFSWYVPVTGTCCTHIGKIQWWQGKLAIVLLWLHSKTTMINLFTATENLLSFCCFCHVDKTTAYPARKMRINGCACMCICLQFCFLCMPQYLHYMQCVHADVLSFVTIAVSVIQTLKEGTHLGHSKLRDQRKTICIYEEAYV